MGGAWGDCNEVGGSQAGEIAASGDRRSINAMCFSIKLKELNTLLYLNKRYNHSQARIVLVHAEVFSRAQKPKRVSTPQPDILGR